MTSEERREARYQRRKAKRDARKAASLAELDDYDKVFTYQHLYDAYRKCRRNVSWKASVQRYVCQAPYNVYQTYQTMRERAFEPSAFYEFDLVERGKLRHIRSVGIRERVVQRCLCDHCLVPALSRTFVYDNGASLEGKGYTFSQERMVRHLRRHYRGHGNEGYVLLFDLTKFFDSIPHDAAKEAVARQIGDPDTLRVAYSLIDAYPGDRGLGLGSQISQIVALAVLNPLDHYIKDHLGVRLYGRYMDDGYVIHSDKNYLRQILAGIRRKCAEIGVTLNERKTQIVKLSHGFTWLKARHWLTGTGRVVRKPARKSSARMRRRLRAFRRKVDEGRMTEADTWQSVQSWRSHVARFDAHRTIRETERLCTELFGPEPRKGTAHG